MKAMEARARALAVRAQREAVAQRRESAEVKEKFRKMTVATAADESPAQTSPSSSEEWFAGPRSKKK